MSENKIHIQGISCSVINKSEFEMVGYKKAANFGDGSIVSFIKRLDDNGSMAKLAATLLSPQTVWVCLSDCQSCGLNCFGFDVCCRVCVEKTEGHDFSGFSDGELFAFTLPASQWVLYEASDGKSVKNLHQLGVYELVKKIGYRWNESVRLHFDNEHDCYNNVGWIDGKTYSFLLPVVPM